MKKIRYTTCYICSKKIILKRNASIIRQTCHRTERGVKSPCEIKKNQQYQKKYREKLKKEESVKKAAGYVKPKSVSTTFHISTHKAVERIKRECLKCEEKFLAKGRFNWICDKCAIANNRLGRPNEY